MGRALIYLALGLILALAVYTAVTMSAAIETPMPAAGWAALIAGAVLSLLLGGVLMGAVFFSARRGFDERASGRRRTPDDPEA